MVKILTLFSFIVVLQTPTNGMCLQSFSSFFQPSCMRNSPLLIFFARKLPSNTQDQLNLQTILKKADVIVTATKAFAPPTTTDKSSAASIPVTKQALIMINGADCVAGEEATLETRVQTLLQASSCPAGSDCSVTTTKLKCQSHQGIGILSSLQVDFDVVLTVFCQEDDCSDSDKIVDAAKNMISNTLFYAGELEFEKEDNAKAEVEEEPNPLGPPSSRSEFFNEK